MNAWQRFRRRRWVRCYALTIVRHSGIGWDDAVALANTALAEDEDVVRYDDPSAAAFDELGIMEADLL